MGYICSRTRPYRGKWRADKTVPAQSAPASLQHPRLFELGHHDAVHLRALEKGRFSACDKDEIIAGAHVRIRGAEGLADHAARAAARHGVSDLLARRDPDADSAAPPVFHHIRDERRADKGFSAGIEPAEIPVFLERYDNIHLFQNPLPPFRPKSAGRGACARAYKERPRKGGPALNRLSVLCPWHGGGPKPCGRCWWTFSYGSRAPFFCGASSADTFSAWKTLLSGVLPWTGIIL